MSGGFPLLGSNAPVYTLEPPPGVYLPRGPVLAAGFAPGYSRPSRGRSAAQKSGIRYEKKAQLYLLERYGPRYCPGPWIKYFADGKWHYCQPDGLLFDLRKCELTIVEIKLSHTPKAWWQLRRLYQPVLAKLCSWPTTICEVVRWYDSGVGLPESVSLVADVENPQMGFKVHIWN